MFCAIKPSPSLSEDPLLPGESVTGLLSSCMCAEQCFPITELSGWLACPTPSLTQSSQALLAQETTKSHHYLDYIMGPPTHAACPRYSKLGCFNTSQTLDLVHCGAVWVRTKQDYRCVSLEKRTCVFTVYVSQQQQQQQRWSDLFTGSDVV